jgi:UDP-glucose 4-epimerase
MRILITGCGGFVGSHLAEAELAAGHSVVGIDLDSSKVEHLWNESRFRFIKESVLKESIMDELVCDADLIYHLAAIANVQTYCDDPVRVMDVNIQAVRVVASSALKHNKKIVFSSSSEVYGKSMSFPFREDGDSLLGPTSTPRWSYSASKIIGEHYLFGYAHQGLRMAICRFFNFYGPRLDLLGHGRVIPCFLEGFLKDKPVQVVEPGDQTRCLTYITDGIAGIQMIAHSPQAEGQVFNIGDTQEVSMIRLASLMKTLGHFSSDIIIVPANQVYGTGHEEIFRRVPDARKIKTMLGWAPTVSLEEGLTKTITWFKENFEVAHNAR